MPVKYALENNFLSLLLPWVDYCTRIGCYITVAKHSVNRSIFHVVHVCPLEALGWHGKIACPEIIGVRGFVLWKEQDYAMPELTSVWWLNVSLISCYFLSSFPLTFRGNTSNLLNVKRMGFSWMYPQMVYGTISTCDQFYVSWYLLPSLFLFDWYIFLGLWDKVLSNSSFSMLQFSTALLETIPTAWQPLVLCFIAG